MPNFSLKDQVVFEAARQFATPFHLYSERGIRQTARALKDAFGEIEDFREYFAVKALPTPPAPPPPFCASSRRRAAGWTAPAPPS